MKRIVSFSGGKDSTATLLYAIEAEADVEAVFADTGHEHPLTYEYVQRINDTVHPIRTIRADFTARMATRRANLPKFWADQPQERIDRALELIQPTGSPFLDLCVLKGRFPSARARFCTEELKVMPITEQVILPALRSSLVESWQGVRRDESRARYMLPSYEATDPKGCFVYRPILHWSVDDVFAMHRRHGVEPNPLYKLGMGRVGCMPCIMARKGEIREIAKRFPEQIERVQEWERIVGLVSKRGDSSLFAADVTPRGPATGEYGIAAVVDWAMTGRGGRNLDLFADEEPPVCSSVYGLCE